MAKKLSRGVAKHLRQEKARIRREISDQALREEALNKLRQKMGYSDTAVDNPYPNHLVLI